MCLCLPSLGAPAHASPSPLCCYYAARQVLLSDTALKLKVTPAPDPRDILWANAAAPLSERATRLAASSALVFAFGLVWFIPLITATQGVGNLGEMAALTGLGFLRGLEHACDGGSGGGDGVGGDDDGGGGDVDSAPVENFRSWECVEYVFLTQQLPVLLQVGY